MDGVCHELHTALAGPWGWKFAKVEPLDLPIWCVLLIFLAGLAMGEKGWNVEVRGAGRRTDVQVDLGH